MHSRLFLALLATKNASPRRQEAGFALALALFVGLTVVIGWLMLAARSSSSQLGAALQSENREARLVAESGMVRVISELNQPRNRMLLAKGNPQDWETASSASAGSQLLSPCGNASGQPPSDLITQVGGTLNNVSQYLPLPAAGNGDRLTRRYRLIRAELENPPSRDNLVDANKGKGYIELSVEGQVLRNNVPAATARITRKYEVVPKCCNRSFRGPVKPDGKGKFGNDDRYCNDNPSSFPQFLVGTGNGVTRNNGGLFVDANNVPELRSSDSNGQERPDGILCYTTSAQCGGVSSADNVPVRTFDKFKPKVPVLGPDGIPCANDDDTCIKDGINKARNGQFSARAIDLIDQNDKDYIRVNSSGKVEICNKASSASGDTAATISNYDRTPTIINGSCELMMGNSDSSKNVCAEQNIDGFKTYHCRISNIFVNDTGATNDDNVRQNNTLFIDSSNGPIYLYVNEDWANTTLDKASQKVRDRLAAMTTSPSFFGGGFKPEPYQAIYTVGNYNDGQIQHVYCGPRNNLTPPSGSNACTARAPSSITSRAAILSACQREFIEGEVVEKCKSQGGSTNTVNAVIGDDGFVRDVFLFLPNSKITLAGDPTDRNLAQGKPQLAAAVWVDNFEFKGRTTQLWVPGSTAEFFGLETSPNDRYAPLNGGIDFVARSITESGLFRLIP